MVGQEITGELGRSREKIESAHARVQGVALAADAARRTLRSMSNRETQQRLILALIAFVLIGGTALVLFFRLKR